MKDLIPAGRYIGQRMPWSEQVGEPSAEEKEEKERRKSLNIAAEKQASSLSIFRYGQRDMETTII
jgi:hypothetical protein